MEYSTLRARARENLRGNWGISIAAAVVACLMGGSIAGSSVGFEFDISNFESLSPAFLSFITAIFSISSTLSLVHLIIGGVIQLGYSWFLLKQHDKQEYSVKDLFSQFDRFGAGFMQMFLRTLYIFLWSLLFIIPGMIKGLSYAMTPYIMADHPELTAKQAIAASQEMMDGYKADWFILGLTFLGWDLLNVLTLGIGSLWLNPYKEATHAAFYREVLAQRRYTTVE